MGSIGVFILEFPVASVFQDLSFELVFLLRSECVGREPYQAAGFREGHLCPRMERPSFVETLTLVGHHIKHPHCSIPSGVPC